MYGLVGRPEYSVLAKWGDKTWAYAIDPVLRFVIGQDDITSLIRIRAGIQITFLAARRGRGLPLARASRIPIFRVSLVQTG